MDIRDKLWMWGYTQEKTGIPLPFTGLTKSYCSLETAAEYFHMPNTVFMNSMHTWDRTEENLQFLRNSRQVICALPHGEQAVSEGARTISRLSRKFSNIKGAVLDDFLQLSGHPVTPELVKEIRSALKSENSELELWVVMYSDINHLDITPYLPLIDGIILWRWTSTEHFWKSELGMLLHRFKALYGKKLMHGVYLQDYSIQGSISSPMDMDLWKLQWTRLLKELRAPSSFLDGIVLLQNGWVSDFAFQEQCLWLKNTLDWYIGTTTVRQ